MKLIQIKEDIENGRNLMFYKKDVYSCFKELKREYLCVYYNEPLPVKMRLVDAMYAISGFTKAQLNSLTIPELTKLLVRELESKTLIILFNHFERLTERSLQIYQYLNSMENIRLICSFNVVKTFKPEIYLFFKTFKLVNMGDYKVENTKDEINITYAVYAILSIYCFFIYMKTSFSCNIASLLLGGAWFAFLIFRTLMYTGGRS
jgi:hypothetical protein